MFKVSSLRASKMLSMFCFIFICDQIIKMG